MKSNDFFGLGTVYYEMANFLTSENKNPEQMRSLGYKMKLIFQKGQLGRMKTQGVERVKILAALDSCKNCLKLSGKIFKIEDALRNGPIPVEKCGHKYGCRCVYLPVISL